jgi:exopolyphosphatase/pppGpp-phosphohydrolase
MKYLFLPLLLTIFSCSSHKPTDAENCLKRKSVAEMGTNSIKLMIADVDTCKKKITHEVYSQVWPIEHDKAVFQEHDGTHSLSHEAKDKTFSVFEEIKVLLATHMITKPDIVATGVYREVSNADILFNKIQNIMGVYPKLLSAIQEAQVSVKAFQAKEGKLPAEYVLWDISGNSMQITTRIAGKTRYVLGGPGAQAYKKLAMQVLKRKFTPNPIRQINVSKLQNDMRKMSLEYLQSMPALPTAVPVFGIGAIHSKSILDSINSYHETKNNFYTIEELRQLIFDTANLTDGQLGGSSASGQVTNALMVEEIMDNMRIDKIRVREVDLTEGYLVFGAGK